MERGFWSGQASQKSEIKKIIKIINVQGSTKYTKTQKYKNTSHGWNEMWSEATVAVGEHQTIGGRWIQPMGSEQASDQPIGGEDPALTGQHFHGSQTFSVLLPSFFKMEEKLFQQIKKIDYT